MYRCSDEKVEAIEAATCGQADNDLWLALCNGRVTSSRFAVDKFNMCLQRCNGTKMMKMLPIYVT